MLTLLANTPNPSELALMLMEALALFMHHRAFRTQTLLPWCTSASELIFVSRCRQSSQLDPESTSYLEELIDVCREAATEMAAESSQNLLVAGQLKLFVESAEVTRARLRGQGLSQDVFTTEITL